jgi:hypothetical protein
MNISSIAAIANVILGTWLVVSSMAWRAWPFHAVNAVVTGSLAVAIGLVARMRLPGLNLLNVMVALWLALSVWIYPHGSAGLVVNHLLVAALMFGFAGMVAAAPEEIEGGGPLGA